MEAAAILHQLPGSVLVVNSHGVITSVSGWEDNLAGHPHAALVGTNIIELIAEDHRRELLDVFAEPVLSTAAGTDWGDGPRRTASFSVKVLTASGAIDRFEVIATHYTEGDEYGWVAIVVDQRVLPPAMEVLRRIVDDADLDTVAGAVARRLSYVHGSSFRHCFALLWPNSTATKLLAGAPDLAIESVLLDLRHHDLDSLWAGRPAGELFVVEREAIPVGLRAAMDVHGAVQLRVMAIDSGQQTAIVLLQFDSDGDIIRGDTRLAYADLSEALHRAVERFEGERLLRDQVLRDPLTGLYNRTGFQALADSAQPGSLVLFIDVDQFKAVNDRYGHHAGDQVLSQIAKRIRRTLRPQDIVARHGGDEFVVVLPPRDAPAAKSIAQRLLTELSRPLPADVGPATVSVSIGIARLGRA